MASPLSVLVCVEIFWSDAVLGAACLRSPGRARLGQVCPALAGEPAGEVAVIASEQGVRVQGPRGDSMLASGPLSLDQEATVELGGELRLCVRVLRDERRALRQRGVGAAGKLLGLALLVQSAIVGAGTAGQPVPEDDESERLLRMRGYLLRAVEREQEEAPTEEDLMGNPNLKPTNNRFVERAALAEAAEFGRIGLLNSGAGGDPNAPASPWGRGDSLGGDPLSARGNVWGADIGDPFGPGGPGLAGAGRPGGTGLRTASRARRGSDEAPAPAPQQAPGVRAGEWDDNANYREFQAYLSTNRGSGHRVLDVRNRQFLVVLDADGRAVPGCEVVVSAGDERVALRTGASGRALLFPRAEGVSGGYTATARCLGTSATARVGALQTDAVIRLDLPAARVLPPRRSIDVAFVLDTTASMSEEIEAVKGTIQQVVGAASRWKVGVRLGLVEFRDQGDSYVTKVHPFTADIEDFSRSIASMRAQGGGDTPEAVEAGLHAALDGLSWNDQAVARVAFLIGDAPPHLDQPPEPRLDYAAAMLHASHRGLPIYTIAASGMDAPGQLVFRQVAQFTGASSLFVLRGGAGAASVGGGDPRSSCGGTQTSYASGNLDRLITQKIERELAAIDGDPLRIAGLGRDELSRPCPAAPRGKRGG